MIAITLVRWAILVRNSALSLSSTCRCLNDSRYDAQSDYEKVEARDLAAYRKYLDSDYFKSLDSGAAG